jgi:hypothetical protein
LRLCQHWQGREIRDYQQQERQLALQCSFRMPVSRYVIAFFVMFGSATVGLCRKFVLGGFSACAVHGLSSGGNIATSPLMRAAHHYSSGSEMSLWDGAGSP